MEWLSFVHLIYGLNISIFEHIISTLMPVAFIEIIPGQVNHHPVILLWFF